MLGVSISAMNTEKISHVVQMTANVGVLIGLSLLVYELNQNNRHLGEQMEVTALQMRALDIRLVAENPELGRLVYGHVGEQPLTDLDELRREDYFYNVFVQWQWVFERERTGLTKQFDSLEQMASSWRAALRRWKAEDIWQRSPRVRFRADFVEFMDTTVIANPG